ncbi:uncharacterized protein HD556DRAFT_1307018 [Suillus plorans]|uniref:Secreted protein n=1 Tax=Suillus plorans TaxID=116603 RepID=A0A9P7DJT8_9AGAM|nr:uncharacterized protein HD556DRAFT_1307018 [Suillus plorans]KAG1796265.1 hypothetical protein HD556DRAFT_1307018 [Suillus plorans]
MLFRVFTIFLLVARPSWLSVVRIACSSVTRPPRYSRARLPIVCERSWNERLSAYFSDDAGLWPQYRTRFYMGVLPPLARIVGNMTETEVGVLPPQSHDMGNIASGNAGALPPQLDSTTIEPKVLSRFSAGMARA